MYKQIISGTLKNGHPYEYHDDEIVLCTDFGDGLFYDIEENCKKYGNYLKFRYYISDKPFDLLDLEKHLISSYFGIGDISIVACGCPTCGEMCVADSTIGGHDVYQELLQYLEKYCIIEIEYYKNEQEFKENSK